MSIISIKDDTDIGTTVSPFFPEPYDKIEELKQEIIKSMNTNNPISRLRKEMIRRRMKKLLKMEFKHKRRRKLS